ncbi:MAG: hypothetical protein NC924_01240 [Candidatus Omnitrophica bacterium]|nr:hypothetical protein [Candidatus Omnitrophota bacterium]
MKAAAPLFLTRRQAGIGRRILVTLGVVAAVRLLYFIPLPGVSLEAVATIFSRYLSVQPRGLFDIAALLHVGMLRNCCLFSLGIFPYLQACVLGQLIVYVMPGGASRARFAGDCRQRRTIVLFLTVALSLVQGAMAARLLAHVSHVSGVNLVFFPAGFFDAAAALSLTAGVLVQLALAGIIQRFGIGHGAAIIFGSEIFIRLVIALDQVSIAVAQAALPWRAAVVFALILLTFVLLARAVTKFSVPVTLCTAAQKSFAVCLRPEWAGVWPVLAAEFLAGFFQPASLPRYLATVSVLVAALTVFYAKIMFGTRHVCEQVLTYRGHSPRRERGPREQAFNRAVRIVLGVSLPFLVIVYFLPLLVMQKLQVPALAAGLLGPFGLLMLIGVWLDARGQLMFYRKISRSAEPVWQCVLAGPAAFEAELAVQVLQEQGLAPCLKSAHFHWGLPWNSDCSYEVFVPQFQAPAASAALAELRRQRCAAE